MTDSLYNSLLQAKAEGFCQQFFSLSKRVRGFAFLLHVYVVVNFLFQVIFIFLLFLGMVIYANEVETKEK